MNDVLARFGVAGHVSVEQIYKSVWSVGGKYILKRNSNAAQLDKSVEISEYLISKGIPVAKYIRAADGGFYIKHQDFYYCLMTRIPGAHIDPFVGDCFQNGKTLGGVVAGLHLALSRFKPEFECYDADLIRELASWIMPELEAKHIAFHDGVLELCRAFEPLYRSLPRQLIHRDMHTGNLLFENGRFAGYLDFDISQRNIRVFDICYLGSSLLVENYRDEERLCLWKKIFSGIWRGYDEVSPLNDDEKRAVPALYVLNEVIFTAFFSKTGQPELCASCVDMTNWTFHNRALLSDF